MTLPPSTDPRWLPRSPYCLSSEGESRLAVARYFVLLPDLRGLSSILGSRSPVARPCRIHTSPQDRTTVRIADCSRSRPIGQAATLSVGELRHPSHCPVQRSRSDRTLRLSRQRAVTTKATVSDALPL